MDNSDVLQRNADGKLEVRVVNGTEKADAPANYDDVFTVNTEGKRALRVVGGGGGGGTGTVTSVNGVQPVDGNVEITGDNITATVGEEEATITQHLTTLKNDEAELGEQVQTNQSDINTLKNQQYPYPEDSEFTVVTLPETAPSNWYRLKLSASVDENATTAIPDGIYGYYAYVKFGNLLSESGSWAEYGKTYAFIKFSVKGGKFSRGEFGGQDLLFVPYIPKQFFTATAAESQVLSIGCGALANIALDKIVASIIDNKIILAPYGSDYDIFGVAYNGGTDERLEVGFTPIRNLETGAELVTSGELVTDIDWETQQILYGTPSPYKTNVSIPAFPKSSLVNRGINGQGIVGFGMTDNHASIIREFIVVLTKDSSIVQAYKIRGDGGRATCLQMGGTPAKLYVQNTGSTFPGGGYEFWIDNRELQADEIYVSYYGADSSYNLIFDSSKSTIPSTAVPIPTYFSDERVAQYPTMPEIGLENFGQIVQYVGETDSNYTHGYFYKANGQLVSTDSSIDFGPLYNLETAEEIPGNSVSITPENLDILVNTITSAGLSESIMDSQWAYSVDQNYLIIDVNSTMLAIDLNAMPDLITFTETPTVNVVWLASNYTPGSQSLQNTSWGRIDVQPTGSVSITTDTSLQGAGTTESPLGISTATMATINGKQDALTAEQLAAVNSGITSAKVASYDAYAGEISSAQSTADKADGAAEVAQQTANLAGQNAAQALTQLDSKVNIAQGADNAGKILGIGADGNVTPVEAPNSGAATLLYYDSTQAPDHSHAMSGVSLEGYGLAGYEVYSNGYVRQWGQDSTSTGTTSVTLPISYTAATTVSMSFFVSVTEVAAEPTGQISAIPVAANQFQVDKPSAICNWETSGYITLS